MSEPLLLAASLLSGEAQVGLTPTVKPETDPWQMVDQMGLLDHQRVQAYQRRSQPLAKSASVVKPEQSSTSRSYEPKVQKTYKAKTINNISPVNSFQVAPTPQVTPSVKPQPNYEWQRSNSSSSTMAIARPSSNSQLYSQRTTAIKAGQLYTRLDSSQQSNKSWVNATQQPTHQDWQNY